MKIEPVEYLKIPMHSAIPLYFLYTLIISTWGSILSRKNSGYISDIQKEERAFHVRVQQGEKYI